MVYVQGPKNLKRLFIAKCAVGDAGLAHVKGLKNLRALNIYGMQITSAVLEHLMGLEDLRILYITDLKLNAAAVNRLKQTLPILKVTDHPKSSSIGWPVGKMGTGIPARLLNRWLGSIPRER